MHAGSEDTNWREKMAVGDDDLRTVECLRGRLLAERQASRVAKEDAELLSKKVIQLERQLKEEINLRNRAEQKLKFLRKVMEDKKLSPLSDRSNSTDNSEVSSISFTTSSDLRDPEKQEPDSQATVKAMHKTEEETMEQRDSAASEDHRHHNSAANTVIPDHQMPSMGSTSSSLITAHPCCNGQFPFQESGNLRDSYEDGPRQPSTGEDIGEEKDPSEDVDNSLALVPVKIWPVSQTCEPQINDGSVYDVLAALRHAKEYLQRSIAKENSIYSVV